MCPIIIRDRPLYVSPHSLLYLLTQYHHQHQHYHHSLTHMVVLCLPYQPTVHIIISPSSFLTKFYPKADTISYSLSSSSTMHIPHILDLFYKTIEGNSSPLPISFHLGQFHLPYPRCIVQPNRHEIPAHLQPRPERHNLRAFDLFPVHLQ